MEFDFVQVQEPQQVLKFEISLTFLTYFTPIKTLLRQNYTKLETKENQ